MDGLFTVLSLGAVMAVASFLAGILPLSLSLSSSQLRLISTIGMGVLVGTSLIVIIPEGVETLYSASASSHTHVGRGIRGSHYDAPRASSLNLRQRADLPESSDFLMPGPVVADTSKAPPLTPTIPGVVSALEESVDPGTQGTEAKAQEKAHTNDHDGSPHAWIGVALIVGFVLMFLVDKLPQYSSAAKPKVQTHHIALNNLGRRFNLTTSLDREDEAENFLDHQVSSAAQSRTFATTTGLVIHAAADGIALGASTSTPNNGLSFIIFVAIMVHKAPAAFGLTSVLLKQGLSKKTARLHLLLFSLAAPLGALVTWMLAHSLGAGHVNSVESTKWWTGMLLLFSGGTFLYVAMHAMQDMSTSQHEPQVNGHGDGMLGARESSHQGQQQSIRDLMAACFGMILPLFLQIGHAH